MGHRVVHGRLGHAQAGGAQKHAPVFQQMEQLLEPSLARIETPLRRQLHIVEGDEREGQHGLADLADGHGVDAGHVAGHEPEGQRRVAARIPRVLVDGGHQYIRGVLAVVHVGLAPVQKQAPVHGLARGFHGHGVGSAVGLGDGQGEHEAAIGAIILGDGGGLGGPGEPAHDLQVEQVVLERQRRAGAAGEFLHDEHLREQAVGQIGRDVRLGGLVVQIDELLHHRIGQALVAAPLGHALRREGVGPERTEGADELLLPVGQREVHLMAPFSLL